MSIQGKNAAAAAATLARHRATKLSAERRVEIARRAATARWESVTHTTLTVSSHLETWLREVQESRCVALDTSSGCIVCWKRAANDPDLRAPSTISATAEVVRIPSVWHEADEIVALYVNIRIGSAELLPEFAPLNYRLLDLLQKQQSLKFFVLQNDVNLSDALLLELSWTSDQRARASRALRQLLQRARNGGSIAHDFHIARPELEATYSMHGEHA